MGPYIHRRKTKEWAIELGFPADVAEIIAFADVMVDNDHVAHPRARYHMRPILFGKDLRTETAEMHLRQALETARRSECDAAWQHLGQGLHVVQDLVAHGNARIHRRWMDYVEFTAGRRDPDQIRLTELERVSKEYLARFLSDAGVRHCLAVSPQ